ncbi:MAG: hypothetical protein IH588_08995 [Anaerolineales bacterium]|nr:hypothetical protein [Anaerolineales bacterium]
MTDILRIFFIVILLTITLAAYFLVIGALFTSRVIKTQSIINQTSGRAFGLGLVNFFFFGLIAFVMLSLAENAGSFVKGVLTIPALLILAFLSVLLSLGLTGMVNVLGERLFSDLPSWRRNIWGTVILCFACALPFVGWFLLLPYISFVGIGASILGFFQRNS